MPKGNQLWEVELTTDVAPLCDGCLGVTSSAVIVLDAAGVLQGFDPATGQLLWSLTLATIPTRLLILNDQPAVIDTLDHGVDRALSIFDPLTGTLLHRLDPRCPFGEQLETISATTPVLYTAYNQSVYFLLGTTTQGCAERWDVVTGERMWQTVVDLSTGAWPRNWFEGDPPLIANGMIYFSGERPEEDEEDTRVILAVDTVTGEIREIVPQDTRYSLSPLALDDDALIVHAVPLSGTGQDELWAISTLGGERYWRYPFDPASSSWTASLTPSGLAIIQLLSGPDRIKVDIVNPQSGVRQVENSAEVNDAVWSGTTWTTTTAWLTIRNLYAVDLLTGKIELVWPS